MENASDEARRVLETYAILCARIAVHYLQNWADAEDVAQDVLVKWVHKQPVFESREHEKAWFIRVTINLCKDRRRAAWFRRVPLDERLAAPETGTPDDEELLRAVRQLPEKYRVVIYLHYYENYTLKDIAALLGKNPHTVQTWHQRAKELLRSGWEDEE